MREVGGDTIPVKASGGIRDLPGALALWIEGASRFGIGYKAAEVMLAQARALIALIENDEGTSPA